MRVRKHIPPSFILYFTASFFFIFFFPIRVWAIMGDTDGVFGLDGSFRTIGAVTVNYDFEPFFEEDNVGFSQSILRLTAGGHPWDRLSYEIHAVQSLNLTTAKTTSSGTQAFNLVPGDTRYRAFDLTWDWLEEDDVAAALWLDRFNSKLILSRVDLTIGRQAITFGKAFFWNPLDVFLPFDPRQFDRDYKAGVDAARLDIPLGDFSGINLIGALGREINASGNVVGSDEGVDASWYGSAVLARLFTNQWEWDWAFQGGKIYGGYQLGGGAVGEIGPMEFRCEAAYFLADGTRELPSPLEGDLVEDSFTGVIGLGHRFENTLTLEGEYLFNGSGDPDHLDAALVRFTNGTSLHLGQHLMGLMGSYEFLPILSGQLAWIFSFSDISSQLQPGLIWSLADEADLLVGASINFGERPQGDSALTPDLQSEFGTFPDVYYMELKVYF